MALTEQQLKEIKLTHMEGLSYVQELCNILRVKNNKTLIAKSTDQYNNIVQCVLLYEALEDGRVDEAEIDFLADIDKESLFLKNINARGKMRYFAKWVMITWDKLPELGPQKDIIQPILKDTLNDQVMEFASTFTSLDKDISSVDYSEKIKERVEGLIKLFATCDGDDVDSDIAKEEYSGTMKLFDDVFVHYWQNSQIDTHRERL